MRTTIAGALGAAWVLSLGGVFAGEDGDARPRSEASQPAEAGPAAPTAGQIEQWIKTLSSADFSEREAATKALRGAGEAARGALEEAAKSEDIEVRTRAKGVLADLEEAKNPANGRRYRLGITMQSDLDGVVVIQSVVPDSPAEKAGIKAGDRLVKFNGADASDADAVAKAVYDAPKGKPVEAEIERDGKALTLKVTLGDPWVLPEERMQIPRIEIIEEIQEIQEAEDPREAPEKK